MRKTPTKLADGRELIYYDEDESIDRSILDTRDLAHVSLTAEIRHDPLLDEWVIIASHRQDRTFLPPSDECPLCPSRPGKPTEVPASGFDVVVFENRFPSLSTDVTTVDDSVITDEALFPRRPGFGRCEVVLFTSDHEGSFAQLPLERARMVVDVWTDRTRDLSEIPGIAEVFVFENCGEAIGVTLSHPHGQIYAYPFVTPRTATMLESARRHRAETGRSLFADVLASEQKAGQRIVQAGRHWTAFVPVAARWPLEVHLYPHRQVPDLPALTDDERADFAALYRDVLQRFDALYEQPVPYIAAWHQAPVKQDRDLAYLHMEVFSVQRAIGKLKYLAGSESGTGVFINDATPEVIARTLREIELPET